MNVNNLRLPLISFVILATFLVLRLCSSAIRDSSTRSELSNQARILIRSYPTANQRAAANQLAQALQAAIQRPEDAMKVELAFEKAQSCIYAINRRENAAIDSLALESAVVDTWKKSKAYIKFNAILSGHDFDPIFPNLQNCEFIVGN